MQLVTLPPGPTRSLTGPSNRVLALDGLHLTGSDATTAEAAIADLKRNRRA